MPDKFLDWAHSHQSATVELIREMVECESPSDSPAGLKRFIELLTARTADLASARPEGVSTTFTFQLPGKSKSGSVLALGHSDTVWPAGTLETMPFRNSEGRLWGPGALDMKGGLALFVFAMRALRELDVPVPHEVVLLVNPDEETGSDDSRHVTEALARESKSVLVLEPGTGLEGKLKTARKGIGDYTLKVNGIASHAGVDFEKGASAIVELAHQLREITRFTDLARGITVNPGVISGGTRSNVIAADASAHIDIRVPTLSDAAMLDRKFQALKPADARCTLQLEGGLNRPPMERSQGIAALFSLARELSADMGVTLEESATGGGSDGNFTAALGIPTLDGIGAVGEGAHALHESIFVDRMPDRIALLAKLVAAIP